MWKVVFTICFAILLAILQLSLIPNLSVKEVYPNLVLIIAIVLVLFNQDVNSIIIAGIGGLVMDFGSSSFFGLNTIMLVGLVFLIRLLVNKYFSEKSALIAGIVTIIGTLVFNGFTMLVSKNWLFINFGYDVVYSLAVGLAIYYLLLHLKISKQYIFKFESKS